MAAHGEFFLYTLNHKGQGRCYASPLPEDIILAKGLPSEALAGEFKKGKDAATEEHFEANPLFLKFLHWAIAKHIRQCPKFQEEAKKKQNGHLLVVDMRSFPLESGLPKEDTLGVVEVKEGEAVHFSGLEDYKVFTDKGFMRIDPWLYEKYLEELVAQVEKKSA